MLPRVERGKKLIDYGVGAMRKASRGEEIHSGNLRLWAKLLVWNRHQLKQEELAELSRYRLQSLTKAGGNITTIGTSFK